MSRYVIKLGTSTLTNGTTFLSHPRMVDLVRQMNVLLSQGHEVILVSSGAMAAGREILSFPQLPKAIPAKQMLSAVGQPRLMFDWGRFFAIYGRYVAQVLLTRGDLRSRRRYLNARNTLLVLLQKKVVPIINENDAVATEEIRVGDNDNLSALVANLVDADYLYLLTDQDGLYSKDPRKFERAELIRVVDSLDIGADLWDAAGGSAGLGTGGMVTKLQAAELARRSGTEVVIARGDAADVILRLAKGELLGTKFIPTSTALESWKRYILSGEQSGVLTVDAGAARAIREGKSLLPAGLTGVRGDFERGRTVGVYGPDGREIACGLVNYTAADCSTLAGLQSEKIEHTLGYYYGDEIIHRSNLVLLF